MKLLFFLVLSLFHTYVLANSDIQNNGNNIPSVEKPVATAKMRTDTSLNKKDEILKIASSTKRAFQNKVRNTWHVPTNASGQKAIARITLTESGNVSSVSVIASDPAVKESVERAVRYAAPYPMPSDQEVRRQVRIFTASFTVE